MSADPPPVPDPPPPAPTAWAGRRRAHRVRTGGVDGVWRTEADDAWHAEHRSIIDKDYSHVRYAERAYSHTIVQVELFDCRVCGYRLLEEHRLLTWTRDGVVRMVGSIRRCRRCHRESWLFTSHMPAVVKARRRDAKVVL